MDFLILPLVFPLAHVLPAWVLGVAVFAALAVDRWLGEPPVDWHPVVWMGNYLGWVGRRVQQLAQQDPQIGPDYKAFCLGVLAWMVGAAFVVVAASALQQAIGWLLEVVGQTLGWTRWPAGAAQATGHGAWAYLGGLLLAALGLGVLLKPLLAWAMLKSEVLAVEHALSAEGTGTLAAGRDRLRWLVSRDVASLNETQVRQSAIETLAENLNDSVVAPIFWFVLLGLPGAALFRFANTADAMWGYPGLYQGRNWAWAGKWAARADDVLGWLPARLTALLLMAVSVTQGAASGLSLARLCEQARRTPSPNSGWPMAAMALVLGVRLAKPGGYVLHAGGRAPTVQDTHRALFYASRALLALMLVAQGATVAIAVWVRS